MDELIPRGKRTAFTNWTVGEALRRVEREKLRQEMGECARVMHDEIMAIQRDFAPLKAEADRLLATEEYWREQ